MSKLTQQPARVPLTDPASGVITREWYRYFTDSFSRMGGTQAMTNLELEQIISRTVFFSTFLSAALGDVLAAFESAFAECATRIDSGNYSRVILDLGSADIGIPPPGLVVPASAKNVTMCNGRLYAIEGIWTEDNADDIAHLLEYEKVSEQGKVWSHRKPIITLSDGCSGFRLENVDLDGKGDASTRQSAGARWKGNTPDRFWRGGKVENVETYGAYIGSATKNDGQVDIDGVEIKPNGRTSRMDRTSYGIILSGNDMHIRNVVADNCHAPLLVTDTGATTFFSGCDFFNGASFDIEGFQHRSIEYHGNSCTFRPDRQGNGMAYMFSHDAYFFPTKFGVTAGSGEDPPTSYFLFFPTKLNDDLQGFGLYPGETPFELATEIAWMGFDPGDGVTTSWAIDPDALAQYKGYVTTMPSGKYTFLQVSATDKGPTIAGGMDGIYMLFSDRTTTKEPRVGAVGNDLIVKVEDEEQIRSTVSGTALSVKPATTALNNNQWTARREGASGLDIRFQGDDGVVHKYDLPLYNLGYQAPIIDVSRAPYFMDEATADNTDLLNTVFADAEALADDLGAVTVYLPGLYNTQGDHIITDRISIDVPNITAHGLNRITGKVGPLLTSTPKAASGAGIRQNQKIRLKMDGNLVGITKLTGTVTSGSDVITGIASASVTAAVVGHLIEGVGIPNGATILAKPSSTSLQISAPADQDNTAKTKIITREAVTLTATAVAGSKVLTLASTTGIKQYMRMIGTNLATDADDLSQWSRVMSFDATTVTMDRDATTSGSFSCTFYAYPEGFLAVEVNQAPSYDPAKEYGAISFYARVTNCGGDGACFRPGRDQVHVMPESKIDLCYGFNYRMTACNDSYFKRANAIASWKAAISIAGQATPRFEGEAGDPYMTDKYGAIEMKSMKECTLLDCDINGIVKITGKTGEVNPVISVIGCNFKFHPSDMNPGGTTNAYLQGGNDARINVIGGGFKWTDGATAGRPEYLFYSAGGATCSMSGVNFFTDPGNPDCAFDVGLCNDMTKFNAQYIDNDTGRLMQGEYTWTPTVSCQTVGDLSVSYAVQSGFAWITNSMAYVRAVVEYTPTFTTASGAIKILGCPVVPRSGTGDWPMQIGADSTSLDWGTFTQLVSEMKSAGTLAVRGQGDNQAQAQLTMANTPTGTTQKFDIFGTFPI
jgi:hypothetical protein